MLRVSKFVSALRCTTPAPIYPLSTHPHTATIHNGPRDASGTSLHDLLLKMCLCMVLGILHACVM